MSFESIAKKAANVLPGRISPCLAGGFMLALSMSSAQADTIIPSDQLMTAIQNQLRSKFVNPPGITDVRAKKIRIVGAKVNGVTPIPNPYWLQDDAVPYVNCSDTDTVSTLEVSATDRSEVTLSKVESNTGSVTVEAGGEFAGVGASVAAGFEHTVETGVSTTYGREVSVNKSQSGTLRSKSGFWVALVSFRYDYLNAPYEVTLQVIEAEQQLNLGKVWLPIVPAALAALPNFVVKGTVSASIVAGQAGLGLISMEDAQVRETCENKTLWGQSGKATMSGATLRHSGLAMPSSIRKNTKVAAQVTILK